MRVDEHVQVEGGERADGEDRRHRDRNRGAHGTHARSAPPEEAVRLIGAGVARDVVYARALALKPAE